MHKHVRTISIPMPKILNDCVIKYNARCVIASEKPILSAIFGAKYPTI